MKVHLVDGTYELFRQFFGRPGHLNSDGDEVGAVRAVTRSVLGMLSDGATHVGVATDHVIESFRNDLYPGYKTGEGMDPMILAQFGPLETALEALGVVVFPMIEYEADDALASAAHVASKDNDVDIVFICTPDKDLAQCVVEGRVLQLDRRNDKVFDVVDVQEKFGVLPTSIPDWLALVGDAADGFPGLPGWGAKSAATVLARYGSIEQIPPASGQWDITVRSGAKLAKTLSDHLDDALLFRTLATLALDAPTIQTTEELRWTGPTDQLEEVAAWLDAPELVKKATELAETR